MKGLPQRIGKSLHPVHLQAGLGNRIEGRGVLVLLVNVSVAMLRGYRAGHGYHRGQAHASIGQASGQVCPTK